MYGYTLFMNVLKKKQNSLKIVEGYNYDFGTGVVLASHLGHETRFNRKFNMNGEVRRKLLSGMW